MKTMNCKAEVKTSMQSREGGRRMLRATLVCMLFLTLSFSVPGVLHCSLIFCAIASPTTSSSKILYSLFYLKHAMSVTVMSRGERAAKIFF